MTDNTPKTHRPMKKRFLVTGFTLFLVLVLLLSVFFYQNFKTVEVQGPSMEPTLYAGQRLLVSKAYWLVGGIRKGDVIVLRNPQDGDVLIKRVFALGDETVNEAKAPENWNFIRDGQYVVPPSSVYVLGDNYAQSEDSRHLGPFPVDEIIGKVIVLGRPKSEARE